MSGSPGAFSSVEDVQRGLRGQSYLADRGLSVAIHLALSLDKPLLLEGEAGVGKTEVAKSLAAALDRRLIRLQCYEGIDASQAGAAGGDPRLAERVVRVLLAEGRLRRVGEAVVDAAALDDLKQEVRRRWPPGTRLDVAGFKDLTGLSRKFVIPLLEYLDRARVTRRSGNDRLVLM